METLNANPEAVYDVPLATEEQEQEDYSRSSTVGPLPEPLLLDNVFWFCKLRWTVVAILVLFGVLSFLPGLFPRLGLRSPCYWPFTTAGVLVAANLFFITQPRRRGRRGDPFSGTTSLWSQIGFDLLVLTAVVHCTGIRETSVHLAYLFHIVLACIFFSRLQSFLVTVLACGLFTACVAAEHTGLLPGSSVYISSLHANPSSTSEVQFIHGIVSIQAIWLVVWYLASRLSAMVRIRDCELAETNQRLLAAQQERARHLLLTTHELKAPFAAIHANTQLILSGYCGVLPDKALDVILRIAARSRRLGHEIQDMLQLANLRAPSQQDQPSTGVNLSNVLVWCVDQARARAQERSVVLDHIPAREPIIVQAVEDHLKMLFGNLLTNAVNYSYEGGTVTLSCDSSAEGGLAVTVIDRGIGIQPEKLPRVFDEYYRTDEAVQHCRESTGLGLAIVRHVAQEHRLLVSVRSRLGEGTKFEVVFPNCNR